MKTINRFMPYIYGVLIIGILIALIALFIRLSKTLKKAAMMKEVAEVLDREMKEIDMKKEQIARTKDSWTFFVALFGAWFIIKETFKYYKSERSLPKSFTKALMRHSSQISKLRF